MSRTSVLFVSDSGPGNSVFDGQVRSVVRAWSDHGPTGLLYRSNQELEEDIPGVEVWTSRRFPTLCRPLWWLEATVNRWRNLLVNFDILHCRGPMATWMVLGALRPQERRNCRILFDCRGAIPEEIAYLATTGFRRWIAPVRTRELLAVQETAVCQADFVATVSGPLSKYLEARHGRRADLVQPCVVDIDRFRFDSEARSRRRRELGLEQEVLFVFVGGTARWQCLDRLGGWWRAQHRGRSSDHLLVLTGSPNEFLESSGLRGTEAVEDVTVDSVAYEEVPSYLSAADYGLLFRDESVVNRVASPVKLSEYLATGLPVLTDRACYATFDEDLVRRIDPTLPFTPTRIERDRRGRAEASRRMGFRLSASEAVRRIRDLFGESR